MWPYIENFIVLNSTVLADRVTDGRTGRRIDRRTGDSILLADRTNGRAYATVLRLSSVVCLSVVCPSVTLCIVAKRCVLEQKLLLRAYRKSYVRNRLVPK